MTNVGYVVAGAIVLLLIVGAVFLSQQPAQQTLPTQQTPTVSQQGEVNVDEVNQLLEDINVDALDVNVTIDLPETI